MTHADGTIVPLDFDNMRCECGETRAAHRRSPLLEDHTFEPVAYRRPATATAATRERGRGGVL